MSVDIPVYNLSGSQTEKITLSDETFAERINKTVLYQAINMYRANARKGTASTKTRGEVSGGGKKPWRQKHTGRARAGSTRSPLWRGGGKVFGPHPRDYSYSIPAKIRHKALRFALHGKIIDKELIVAQGLEDNLSHKTRDYAQFFKNICNNDKILVVLAKISSKAGLGLRNLSGLTLVCADNLNAFEVLNHAKIVVSMQAWQNLEKKL